MHRHGRVEGACRGEAVVWGDEGTGRQREGRAGGGGGRGGEEREEAVNEILQSNFDADHKNARAGLYGKYCYYTNHLCKAIQYLAGRLGDEPTVRYAMACVCCGVVK